MKELVKQIEARFGLSHVTTKLFETSFLLERDSNHATISVVSGRESGKYSVQIETPDETVPLIGFDVHIVGDRLSAEQMFEAVGRFIRNSESDEPHRIRKVIQGIALFFAGFGVFFCADDVKWRLGRHPKEAVMMVGVHFSFLDILVTGMQLGLGLLVLSGVMLFLCRRRDARQ